MSNRQGLPFPPAKLNTPAFVKAWGEWMTHMGQMNKPMTPLSASKIFTKLEALGPDRAVVAIEHSIASSWVSINEPITRTNGHSNGAHETRHEAERRKKKEREFTEPPRNMKIL